MNRPIDKEIEFAWNDDFVLGYASMDETHKEFVACVQAMDKASDSEFAACYKLFVTHIERHFKDEARWMSETDFPAMDCHVAEHQQVLEAVSQVYPLVVEGNLEPARRLVQALKDWFPGHADYLDSALAKWMVKRSTGGSPIVIRRTGKTSRSANAKTSD